MSKAEEPPLEIYLIGPNDFVVKHIIDALSRDKKIHLSGPESDSSKAVSTFRKTAFDAVIIDIGSQSANYDVVIRRLCKIDPRVKIILVASLNFPNVKNGMKLLLSGASEFIITPAEYTKTTPTSYKTELTNTVIKFARLRRTQEKRPEPKVLKSLKPSTDTFKLRDETSTRAEYLAIGSSTGGPNALRLVLSELPKSFSAPIFITQHMPANFTPILAKNLASNLGRATKEAEDGEVVQDFHVYIAPGGYHMSVEKKNENLILRVTQGPPENMCRPSVEPLFRSLAKSVGKKCLAVMLTGMGRDGSKGSLQIADAGGTVIAQDFESSVVWGMPGAAVNEGACTHVLPVTDIAPYIIKKFS